MMRLRLHVYTAATSIPREQVLAPGRAIGYSLLRRANPDLGHAAHEHGIGGVRRYMAEQAGCVWTEPASGKEKRRRQLAPFGHSAPVFPHAEPVDDAYQAGGEGWVEFGSPLPAIVEAWGMALQELIASPAPFLDWGGVALRVNRVEELHAPAYADGRAVWRTQTPVIARSGEGEDGWLYPGQGGAWTSSVSISSRRKLQALNQPTDFWVRHVRPVGPVESHTVAKSGHGIVGHRKGVRVEVEVHGEPVGLRALWTLGLGQNNAAGFGWIDAWASTVTESRDGTCPTCGQRTPGMVFLPRRDPEQSFPPPTRRFLAETLTPGGQR